MPDCKEIDSSQHLVREEIKDLEQLEHVEITIRQGLDEEHLKRTIIAREQRLERDKLLRERKAMLRSVFTASQAVSSPIYKIYSPSVQFYASCNVTPADYDKHKKAKSSCLRHTSGQQLPKRQVTITTQISTYDVYETEEDKKIEIEIRAHHWQQTVKYSPVRHMQMTALHAKFGKDSSDPEAWMEHIEKYNGIEELFYEVKDAYQNMYDEETVSWQEIEQQARDSIAKSEIPEIHWLTEPRNFNF